jgi:16S rRNA G966 N2-methylase RsmD
MEKVMYELVSTNDLAKTYNSIFEKYDEEKYEIQYVSNLVKDKDIVHYFIEGNAGGAVANGIARRMFEASGALAALNANYWSSIMQQSGVLNYMTAKMRNEWNNLIRERKTPEFERKAVIETIKSHLLNRESYMADKVDGVFQKLSRRHVTNSPFAFRERMIMEYMHSDGSVKYEKAEYIDDFRTVVCQLLGRDRPGVNFNALLGRVTKAGEYGKWVEFDGGTFKMRTYKVGTAHFEVHPEIAIKLNRILATKYPQVIASDDRTDQKIKQIKVKPLEHRYLSEDTIFKLDGLNYDHMNSSIYVNSSRSGQVDEVLKHLGGVDNGRNYHFDYDPTEAIKYVVRMGLLPDRKSYQFYPTTEKLAQDMVYKLGRLQGQWNYYDLLEPSAGHGALLDACKSYYTRNGIKYHCVDIDPVNCEILKSKGYTNVTNIDFLQMPIPEEKFDAVIMNPPFNQGQAEAHVRHAFNMLTDSGVLIACLPASFRGKEFLPGVNHNYSCIYEDHFEETTVSVVILSVKKRTLSEDE